MRFVPLVILAASVAAAPVMAECNTAPVVGPLAVEALDKIVQVDVLAAASDAEGHPLSVLSPSTTCDASVAVDFDLLSIDPDPSIREECTVSFTVEDELGETTTGTVTVRVIADIFRDTFESGNTIGWTG